MGRLTTHVLDTALGVPAKNMKIGLYELVKQGSQVVHRHIKDVVTNHDGRISEPLLEGAELASASYELVFQVGAYFKSMGSSHGGVFLDEVPIRFRIQDAGAHYHVPLLVSPWAYSTYRGS
jgi:5-hydroxyisourate hydrolase